MASLGEMVFHPRFGHVFAGHPRGVVRKHDLVITGTPALTVAAMAARFGGQRCAPEVGGELVLVQPKGGLMHGPCPASPSGFKREAELAAVDWRDVLMNGDVAHDDWPGVLDSQLGPDRTS